MPDDTLAKGAESRSPPIPVKREIEVLDDDHDGQVTEEKQLEGGEVSNIFPSSLRDPEGMSTREAAKARSWVTKAVFLLLIAVIVLHYGAVVVFTALGKTDIKAMETAFNTALPVISGLAGVAAAFYFKDRGR